MSGTVLGPINWEMERDDDGYRDYHIQQLINTDDPNDGPTTVLLTPGLPLPGSRWFIGNDQDFWAICRPELKISPVVTRERNTLWVVENTFSNRPLNRCGNNAIDNPLQEPYQISGSFVEYLRQATQGWVDGANTGNPPIPLMSSSFEQFTGAIVERDDSRLEVEIEWNVAQLPLFNCASLLHHRNQGGMWGLDPGMIKFSSLSFQKLYYGICNAYYRVHMGFKVDVDKWVRYIPDCGYKRFNGTGSRTNPKDYVLNRTGEDDPVFTFLDGNGTAVTSLDDAHVFAVQFYGDADLLSLGVPSII